MKRKIMLMVLAMVCAFSCMFALAACNVEDEPPAGHTHSYSADWSHNDTQHWHECTCGEKKDVASHSYKNGTCVCGLKQTVDVGGLGEECKHDSGNLYPVTDHKDASCTEQGYDLNVFVCTHAIKDPSGYKDGICGAVLERIGDDAGNVIGQLHNVFSEYDLKMMIENGEIKTRLAGCRTTIDKTPHTPVVDPAVPATCAQKGLTEGSHCGVCSAVITAQTETDYTDHSYTDDISFSAATMVTDKVCTGCGRLQQNTDYVFKAKLNADEQSYTLEKGDGWKELHFGSLRYNGKPVTVIGGIEYVKNGDFYYPVGKGAFKNCTTLTYVNFSGVKVIGGDAFTGCTNLGRVNFGSDLEVIASYAFQQCAFTGVSIPSNVETIGWAVFYRCNNLQSITIPFVGRGTYNDKYCVNGDYSSNFYYIFGHSNEVPSTLKNVTITGGSVRYFGSEYGGGNIESVTLGDDVDLGYNAFSGCTSLKNITIGKNVKSIGGGDFYGCDNLANIKFNGTLVDWCAINGLEYLMQCGTSDKTLTINNQTIKGTVVIPDGVTTLPDFAFYNCGITDITIPDSVKTNGGIGSNTFHGCPIATAKIPASAAKYVNNSALKTVVITSGGYIDERAFGGCSTLTNITIPNSIESIGNYAFRGCSGLTSITIPDSVEIIYEGAFSGCVGLESVTMGNSVTSIGFYAFEECSGLTSIYTDDVANWCGISGLDSIMSNGITLYINGEELTGELVIPDGVTGIGNYAFYGCSGVTGVKIPDTVKSIGTNAFGGCPIETATIPTKAISAIKNSALKTVVITSGDSIDSSAFEGCSNLTSITIPDSVTSISYSAFYDCSSLTSINYIGDVASWCGISGLSAIMSDGRTLYINGAELTDELVIPDSVTDIASYAFYGCSKLTTITIPNSIKSIGNYAFCGCSGLTSITIPDSVKSIGTEAFRWCEKLKTLTINSGVETIGTFAFADCAALEEVTIPDSITSIGYSAFDGCSSLTSINYIGDVASWCGILGLDNVMSDGRTLYMNGAEPTGDLIIPDGVTKIDSRAFYGCSKLTSLKVADSVNIIDEKAFYGCVGLESVTMGNSVTRIGSSAFEGCSKLANLTIPDSAEDIGLYAFKGCPIETAKIPASAANYVNDSALKTVEITSGSIKQRQFYECTSLERVTLGDSVTSIGSYAFYGCSGLTSIYYTGNIADWCGISGLDNIMSNGRKLYINGEEPTGELVIPDGVTSIATCAFYDCSKLTSIKIPSSVKSLGDRAFERCAGLKNIYYMGDLAGWCGISGLSDVMYYGKTLYINGAELTGDIVIPSGITSIEPRTFYNCSKITGVTIPDGVTSIGLDAFDGCSNLTSVTIPDGVESIGNYAFGGCINLTNVTIPDGVKSIGSHAFDNCKKLTSIAIPSSVTSIGSGAFDMCFNLTTVTISGAVTRIESYMFNDCNKLTSITIPAEVTKIGNYAFRSCSNLTSITFLGTIEQWNAITMGIDWNLDTGNYTVHCSDGDITKN